MRYFCNFSLVSLGTRPRSRRCAERTRQGEGRWSRPLKAALEPSYIRPRISVPRIAYLGRDKKLLTKVHDTKEWFDIYLYFLDDMHSYNTYHIFFYVSTIWGSVVVITVIGFVEGASQTELAWVKSDTVIVASVMHGHWCIACVGVNLPFTNTEKVVRVPVWTPIRSRCTWMVHTTWRHE